MFHTISRRSTEVFSRWSDKNRRIFLCGINNKWEEIYKDKITAVKEQV